MGGDDAMSWLLARAGDAGGTLADPLVWQRTAERELARGRGFRARAARRISGRLRPARPREGVLTLPFLATSADFRRGVEYGMLWERVKVGPVALPVHADMADLVMSLAGHYGLTFGAIPEDGPCPCGRCEPGTEWLAVMIGQET